MVTGSLIGPRNSYKCIIHFYPHVRRYKFKFHYSFLKYKNILAGYMELLFDQVTKSFGDLNVIKQFDTTIKTGEIVALVSPSGCGKSTFLHMVAGLQSASSGTLTANGQSVSTPSPQRTLVFSNRPAVVLKEITLGHLPVRTLRPHRPAGSAGQADL